MGKYLGAGLVYTEAERTPVYAYNYLGWGGGHKSHPHFAGKETEAQSRSHLYNVTQSGNRGRL